ncbi:hypothetical protein GALL_499210 [mine drainage metagenome]|uniref:Uncharacterized protein n=1 Tax=mine drainage metagenome TaxID=410659 RepID=A0A1J5PL31_9ZZZZ
MVALSLIGTDDLPAQVEIAKNLYSEFGYGNLEKAHIVLLKNYLQDLLSRLADRPYPIGELQKHSILSTTEDFIREQRMLYGGSGKVKNPRHVLGTLLSQEWLAYSMLTRLYEGARNYQHLYPSNDVFHEHCEYFYVHIGDAEKEHKIQAVKAAAQECYSDADIFEISESFNRFLDITARYWNGISEAMRAMSNVPLAAA